MSERFRPRVEQDSTEQVISRDMLSARLELAMLAALNTPGIDMQTKIRTMGGIGVAAMALADHWGLEGNSRRTFMRACGFRGDGALTAEMIERLAEIAVLEGEGEGLDVEG